MRRARLIARPLINRRVARQSENNEAQASDVGTAPPLLIPPDHAVPADMTQAE